MEGTARLLLGVNLPTDNRITHRQLCRTFEVTECADIGGPNGGVAKFFGDHFAFASNSPNTSW